MAEYILWMYVAKQTEYKLGVLMIWERAIF